MIMISLRGYFHRLYEFGPQNFFDRAVGFVLWLPSQLYGMVVRLRRFAYDTGLKKSYRAAVPVISVGNLTVGGTGKTPMADFLARWAARHGVAAAIVSRGYGGRYSTPVLQVSATGANRTSPELCGDEPFLLSWRNPDTPVFVARRRAVGVRAAERTGARLIILDDGFQHRAVQRDLDIVLMSGNRPFGCGQLLPAGPLREPKSSLKRADMVVLTRMSRQSDPALSFSGPVLRCRHVLADQPVSLDGTRIDWQKLKGEQCLAFAGIGRPGDFFAALKERGLTLVREISLADHQVYDAETLSRLVDASRDCAFMLTTEKDGVKLTGFELPIPCYQVGVALEFADSAPLEAMLLNLLADCEA